MCAKTPVLMLGGVYVKYILTHAEYDKDEWKNDPYF
jgi:mRNA-degrading endonuclease HigB of HigAB toxin-antitoxin module